MKYSNTHRILYYKIFILLPIILLVSCVDNKTVIDDLTDIQNGPKYNVFFLPRLESNYARSLNPFPSNCMAEVYAYNNKAPNTLYRSELYYSATSGTLTPTLTTMNVVAGNYDFYAISCKNSNLPPVFVNGVTSDLNNGVDYLWCHITNQNVVSSSTNVPITFTHSCSQVVINLKPAVATDSIVSVVSAYIECSSDTGNTWTFNTGKITPSTSLANGKAPMQINGTQISLIMLPLNYNGALQLYVEVLYKGKNTPQNITMGLPVPSGGFVGGSSYVYLAELYSDAGELDPVLVAPWTYINNDSKPIYTYIIDL